MGYPGGSAGRGAEQGCGCALAVLTVVGLICGVVSYGLWDLHHKLSRTPPDIGAFADSAATRAADDGAQRTATSALGGLTSAVPWAVPLGTSVADSCETRQDNPFIGPADWEPISCTRTTVAYVAFDGDIRTRLHQLDSALGAQEWTGSDGRPTLTAAATWLSEVGGDPSPNAAQRGSTEPPGSEQIALSVTYLHGEAGHRPFSKVGTPRLEVAVAGRPIILQVETGDLQGEGPPKRRSGDDTVYRAWHPLSTDAVSRSAYAAHHYVAAFSFTDRYAVQQPRPAVSPTPSPTGGGLPPCVSGSLCN